MIHTHTQILYWTSEWFQDSFHRVNNLKREERGKVLYANATTSGHKFSALQAYVPRGLTPCWRLILYTSSFWTLPMPLCREGWDSPRRRRCPCLVEVSAEGGCPQSDTKPAKSKVRVMSQGLEYCFCIIMFYTHWRFHLCASWAKT